MTLVKRGWVRVHELTLRYLCRLKLSLLQRMHAALTLSLKLELKTDAASARSADVIAVAEGKPAAGMHAALTLFATDAAAVVANNTTDSV